MDSPFFFLFGRGGVYFLDDHVLQLCKSDLQVSGKRKLVNCPNKLIQSEMEDHFTLNLYTKLILSFFFVFFKDVYM